jgi:O-antigen ligase
MTSRTAAASADPLDINSARGASGSFDGSLVERTAHLRTVRPEALAGFMVAAAIVTSTIVFSEPAVADMIMAVAVVSVPLLGATKLGRTTLFHSALWLAIMALGLAGTALSTTFDTAIKHQLVTLFLVCGTTVLAGFITADPERRWQLIMTCYVAACLIATAAALIGYFQVLPGAYDLFTNYGRARGTFKDPNVYGAAIAPALVYLVWVMLRSRTRHAVLAGAAALPLVLGLLLSFSRGAWISAGLSIVILAWISCVRTRRIADTRRLALAGTLSLVVAGAALFAILQVDAVQSLIEQRASLDQSYDEGPDGRFGGQEKAKRLILDHPFGIGTHTFRDTYHHEEAHNVYLSMFLNAGWIGGLLFLISVIATLFAGLRRAFETTALQGAFIVSASAFAGVAFEGIIIDSDHWRHIFILMACVWGLSDAQVPLIDPARRRDDDLL